MSTIRRQDQEKKAALSKIQQENRNDYCADCSEQRKLLVQLASVKFIT